MARGKPLALGRRPAFGGAVAPGSRDMTGSEADESLESRGNGGEAPSSGSWWGGPVSFQTRWGAEGDCV